MDSSVAQAQGFFAALRMTDRGIGLYTVTEEFSLFEDDEREDMVVNYTYKPEEPMFTITKDPDGAFRVSGDKLRRIFDMTDFNIESSIARFARQLRSFGVDEELRKMGAKDGDTVRVFEFVFEFYD